ncbi:MAG: TolC family protein, partial [Myxococcaceae bacterium]
MIASLLLALGALVSDGATPAGPPGAVTLDLGQSLGLARAHSRKLQDRRTEVEIAGERRGEAFSRFLPRLGVLARYTRLSYVAPGEIALPFSLPGQPPPEPVRLGEPVEDQVSLRLTLDQPLFTGFALSEAFAAAGHAEAAAKERLVLEDQELEVRVEEAYLTLLKARKLREVADQSVRQLEAHLSDFERLLAEGAVTGVEVARGQARLASARLMQIQTGGAAELAQLSLATLLGLAPDSSLWLEEPPLSFDRLPDAASVRAQALSKRPELAIAREGAA